MTQPVKVIKDYKARMRASGYLSLLFLMLFTIPLTIPIILLRYNNGLIEITLYEALAITVLAEIITMMAAVKYAGQQKTWKKVFGLQILKTNFKKNLLKGFGIGLLAFFSLQILAGSLQGLTNIELDEGSETSTQIANLTGIPGLIVLLIIVPFVIPFIEEVFFRGYTLGFLLHGYQQEHEMPTLKNFKIFLAVSVSAVFFGFAHIQGFSSYTDVLIIVWTTIFGFILANMRVKTGTVYPSIVAHSTYNLLTSIGLLLVS